MGFHWISPPPCSSRRLAVVVPEYNECSSGAFHQRVRYFFHLADSVREWADVFLVDDGSTDASRAELERLISSSCPSNFYACACVPNSNKVGAIFDVLARISHDFVLLTDFDSDLLNVDRIRHHLESFLGNPTLMGSFLRMVPYPNGNPLVGYQAVEYAAARARYRVFRGEGTVPVMPGAGCVYRRRVLKKILQEHSGRRSGEDRESTIIGLRLGYSVTYEPTVVSLTRTPVSLGSLFRQRVRWNHGYLETLLKERGYYASAMRRKKRIGLSTIGDMISVALLLAFVPVVALLLATDPTLALRVMASLYGVSLLLLLGTLALDLDELATCRRWLWIVPVYPIIRMSVEMPAWCVVICGYRRRKRLGGLDRSAHYQVAP